MPSTTTLLDRYHVRLQFERRSHEPSTTDSLNAAVMLLLCGNTTIVHHARVWRRSDGILIHVTGAAFHWSAYATD